MSDMTTNMTNSFKTWVKAPVGTYGKSVDDPVLKSDSSYQTYLNNAVQRILESPAKSIIPNRYLATIFNDNDYLTIIEGFIYNEDLLFALTTAEVVLKFVNSGIDYHKKSGTSLDDKNYKELRNSCSALNALLIYLNSNQIWIDKFTWTSSYNTKQLSTIRNSFRKPDIHKIDGNECLMNVKAFDFIRMAIENSYFFDPDSTTDRHQKIVTCITNNQELPARWSSENGAYNKTVSTKKDAVNTSGLVYKGVYPVKIDGNGNAQVKSQISIYTGYTVSGGIDTIFQNYEISHIWGNAYDPRYFTNLWNLVLVPSWANDLLDKDEYAPGASPLVIKLKSTFKAICLKHYKMKGKDYDFNLWNGTPTHLTKVVKGEYMINCISQLQSGEKLSAIKKVSVKV